MSRTSFSHWLGPTLHRLVNFWRALWYHRILLSQSDPIDCPEEPSDERTQSLKSSNVQGQSKSGVVFQLLSKLYSLATFKIRPHKLLLDRCSGTVSDIVRRLTVKMQKEINLTPKHECQENENLNVLFEDTTMNAKGFRSRSFQPFVSGL